MGKKWIKEVPEMRTVRFSDDIVGEVLTGKMRKLSRREQIYVNIPFLEKINDFVITLLIILFSPLLLLWFFIDEMRRKKPKELLKQCGGLIRNILNEETY